MKKEPEQFATLLKKARNDLVALKHLTSPLVDNAIFGFHAQQAVEKTLKSWLALLKIKFPRIHDLEELASLLRDHKVNLDQFESLLIFTPFSAELRYTHIGYDEVLDRDRIIFEIETLIEHVEKLTDSE